MERLSSIFATFTLQPTKKGLLSPIKSLVAPRFPGLVQRLGKLHQRVEESAGTRLHKLSRFLHVDGLRLATAYAESVIFRIALKPILVQSCIESLRVHGTPIARCCPIRCLRPILTWSFRITSDRTRYQLKLKNPTPYRGHRNPRANDMPSRRRRLTRSERKSPSIPLPAHETSQPGPRVHTLRAYLLHEFPSQPARPQALTRPFRRRRCPPRCCSPGASSKPSSRPTSRATGPDEPARGPPPPPLPWRKAVP